MVNLKFEDISDRSVRVLWDEPEQSNGILKGYTLSYMVKDAPHTKIVKNLTADVSTYTVTELSVSEWRAGGWDQEALLVYRCLLCR